MLANPTRAGYALVKWKTGALAGREARISVKGLSALPKRRAKIFRNGCEVVL